LQRLKVKWNWMGWLAAGIAVALMGGGLVWAQIFGLGEYPGGQLRTVYSITGEDDPSPGSYTLEITPEGDKFRVRTVFESLEAQEDIDVGVFGFGFGFRPEERIDLTPLSALDEREVEPGKSLVLPGGARLQTQEAAEIASVPVVMAVYTHPDFPDQRAIVAIPGVETRRLLVFPPLVQVEREEGDTFEVITKIELIEFAREP
jgi:hypothetical protein